MAALSGMSRGGIVDRYMDLENCDRRMHGGALMAAPRYTLVLGDFWIRHPDLPRNGPGPDGDTMNLLPDNDDRSSPLAWLFGGYRVIFGSVRR